VNCTINPSSWSRTTATAERTNCGSNCAAALFVTRF